MKFSKIFDLPNENQLLLVKDYNQEDEHYEIVCTTEVRKMRASMNFGFDSEEQANKMIEEFNQENALEIRKQILSTLGFNDEVS